MFNYESLLGAKIAELSPVFAMPSHFKNSEFAWFCKLGEMVMNPSAFRVSKLKEEIAKIDLSFSCYRYDFSTGAAYSCTTWAEVEQEKWNSFKYGDNCDVTAILRYGSKDYIVDLEKKHYRF